MAEAKLIPNILGEREGGGEEEAGEEEEEGKEASPEKVLSASRAITCPCPGESPLPIDF